LADSRILKLRRMADREAAFSLTELVVALAIALILLAIGLPAFMRAYRSYQLTNSAIQLGDMLRYARYEAIRLNKQVNCVIQVSPSDPSMSNVFADLNGNGLPDPTERITLLGNGGNLVAAGGVPGTAALIAAARVTSGTTIVPPAGMTIAFDSRGAVVPPTNVAVFYLGSGISPDSGFRAVLLMPAGSIQVWSGDTLGNWTQLR
jgi:prepilin-type N-terminal cleavage/methylation domain-containing protein